MSSHSLVDVVAAAVLLHVEQVRSAHENNVVFLLVALVLLILEPFGEVETEHESGR